jgi:hypothetical protein
MTTDHTPCVAKIKSHVKNDLGLYLNDSGSLPFNHRQDSTILQVDVVVCLKQKHDITHIIEYETSTLGTVIVGKSILINESVKKMVEEGTQIGKPKVIFLYATYSTVNLNKMRYILEQISHYFTHINAPVVEYYADDWDKYM